MSGLEETSGRSENAETVVPTDSSAVCCPYCDQPFHDDRLQALHLGLEHEDQLDERERAAFETAYSEEEAELRRFRLVVLGIVIAIYFLTLFTYAFVT